MVAVAGSGNTFYIRPVAMRPDDYKIVAAALHDVLQNATASADTAADGGAEAAAPEGDASGSWEVTVTYTSGAPKQHRFTIAQDKLGALAGVHSGSITESPLTGQVSGMDVSISSELPSPGGGLPYEFSGTISADGQSMGGGLQCPAQEAAAPTGGAAEVAGEAAWSATRAGGSRL